VIHESGVVAVQLHSGPDAVTTTGRVTPVPGIVGKLTVVRSSWNTQLVPCCTVTVCPAMRSDPVLALKGLDATVKATEPFPFPFTPDVTVIQGSLLAAVHAHPAPAETVMLAGPPTAFAEYEVGVSVYVQAVVGDGPGLGLGLGPGLGPGFGPGTGVVTGADWLMVAVLLAIVMVPTRNAPPLEAALNLTEPLPVPDAVPVTVIQSTSATPFHEHPASVLTLIVPGPPAAVMVRLLGLMV
jgi:hypothetical protein